MEKKQKFGKLHFDKPDIQKQNGEKIIRDYYS